MKLILKLCLIWLSYSSKLRKKGAARVVVIEGFGSDCSYTNKSKHKFDTTTEVICLNYINPLSSFFGNVSKNVNSMCNQLQKFAAESENYIYLIGISQGGFVAYLLLENCFNTKIKKFAAVGSPLLGTNVLHSNMSFLQILKFFSWRLQIHIDSLKKFSKKFSKKFRKLIKGSKEIRKNHFPFVYLRTKKDNLPTSELFKTHFLIKDSSNNESKSILPFEKLEQVNLYRYLEDKIVSPPNSSIFGFQGNSTNVAFDSRVKLNLCEMLLNNRLQIINQDGAHLKGINLKIIE